MLKLFSTNCPKCKVLKTKIEQKNIDCELIEDLDKVREFAEKRGLREAPLLEIEDGQVLTFTEANKYINNL